MSTKDKIIFLLSKKWPLNAMHVYNTLKKTDPSANLTYQAVHKSLKELLVSNVIVKNPQGYRIDTKWVADLKKFTNDLDEGYHNVGRSADAIKMEVDEKGTVTLVFNSPEEAYDWWIDLDVSVFGKHGYNMCKHEIYPLITMKKLLKRYSTVKWTEVLGGDTAIDLWVDQKNKMKKVKSVCGVKDACAHWALISIGDYIIQGFPNEDVKNKIYCLFEKAESPIDFDFQAFFSIIQKPSKYKIVITKDREIAENYKKQMLDYIKNEEKTI
jgi:hypothetical protein